jgi:hypothetical protein
VRPPAQRLGARLGQGQRNPRAKVMARRRRMTTLLFAAFTLGAIAVAVGGIGLLWVPAVPAVLLTLYIGQMRRQERRRFEVRLDQRQAAEAARRLRSRRQAPPPHEHDERPEAPAAPSAGGHGHAQGHGHGHARPTGHAVQPPAQPRGESAPSPRTADRRALVEQTDHAEWVDQQRERQRGPGRGDSWDPVPVPLPTYVTAPVAPRATSSVDLGAPDAWSSARSSAAEPSEPEAEPAAEEGHEAADTAEVADDGRSDARRAASARRARERGRTPLFDQYEDGERPRAANE